MKRYRSYTLFLVLCLLFASAGCDDSGNADPAETFRFFDELDFFDDPTLRHDPENGIHLTFLEPPEAEFLPAVILQNAMLMDPENEIPFEWAQLDAPGADIGVDYHIYDVGLQGRYSLSFTAAAGVAARSSQNVIAALADMSTGEVIAGVRYIDGGSPVFDLVPGSYIALVTSEDYLDNRLPNIAELKVNLEDTCNSNPITCASYVLDNTMAVTWSMGEQAAIINDSFNGGGNMLQKEAAGVMELAEEDLPEVLQNRAALYRDRFIAAFNIPGDPLPEIKSNLLEPEPDPDSTFDLDNPPGLDIPTCASGAEVICVDEPIPVCNDSNFSDPLCASGTAFCQDNMPMCGSDIPVIVLGLDNADEGAELNDGLDAFSDDELGLLNSNAAGIVGGM